MTQNPTKYLKLQTLIYLIAALALMAFVTVPAALAQTPGEEDEAETEFAVATIYFELNNTDGDLGIHAMIDGEPWETVVIEDPDEAELLDVTLTNRLLTQGLTELFFESAEPPFEELAPEDFFDRFPEGEYVVEGTTTEGVELTSTTLVTHIMPAPAAGIDVSGIPIDPVAVDCDEGPIPEVTVPVVISWDPVTESHPTLGISGEEVETVRYQIVVEWEDEEENVFIFSTDLPPSDDRLQITVPPEFTDLGDEFKFEILVRESSGNQTAVESCFEID